MSDVEKFATKHRCKSIDSYVGNDFVKSTMLRRFHKEPYPQAIMLFGGSGTGKTTLARLLAKHIVCEDKREVEIKGSMVTLPCDECMTCQSMNKFIETGDDGDLYNVKELDASEYRRAENIDAFISEASVPSMYGGYHVYIIDECHVISNTGQNSFLKFIEDPPEGKIFIFCTTDKHKVLNTLINRCLVFEIKKPTLDDVVESLKIIADAEGISYELGALKLIAERSNYVYREAINNLENVFRSFKLVSVKNASESLDVQSLDLFFDFFKYLIDNNIVMYSHVLHLVKVGIGYESFYTNLLEFVKRGLYIKNGIPIEGLTKTEMKNFSELFKRFSVDEVYSLLAFLNDAREGDLEIKFFTLGYRGLQKVKEEEEKVFSEPTEITVSDRDLANELQIQHTFKEHKKELKREETESDANKELEELSLEDMSSLFNF